MMLVERRGGVTRVRAGNVPNGAGPADQARVERTTDVAIDGRKEVLTTVPATRLLSIWPCDARAVTRPFARWTMAVLLHWPLGERAVGRKAGCLNKR